MGKRIIPQHEPLRVPKGWTEQARAFVIQLERIIDRIYAYVSGGFSKHDEEISSVNTAITETNEKIRHRMFPIQGGTYHSSAVDFNTFLENGIHTFAQNAVVASSQHAPCAYGGRLCVWINNGEAIDDTWRYGIQIYYSIYGNIYVRGMRTADTLDITFDAWKELAMRVTGGFSGYTPSITAGSGFAVSNVSFNYTVQGNMLFVSGRFNITNAGEAQKAITISLPSGMTAYTSGVGACGTVAINKTYSGPGLSVRCDGGTSVFIQAGAGGYCTDLIGTGYVVVGFTCFLQ